MRRRDFITVIGDAAVWPLAAHPQQPERVRRIGAPQSGHSEMSAICPLSGVKQTGLPDDALSAFDPKRT